MTAWFCIEADKTGLVPINRRPVVDLLQQTRHAVGGENEEIPPCISLLCARLANQRSDLVVIVEKPVRRTD